MKNNNFISFVTALIIGFIIGGGVIGLLWHNSKKSGGEGLPSEIKEITLKEKQMYLEEYSKPGTRQLWNMTRISLFMHQYDAMTYLLKKNPNLRGFRFTPGIVGDPKEVIVVTGVDAAGKDDATTPPLLTPVDPCPPCCDGIIPPEGQ